MPASFTLLSRDMVLCVLSAARGGLPSCQTTTKELETALDDTAEPGGG
jgi:hypothetical protein